MEIIAIVTRVLGLPKRCIAAPHVAVAAGADHDGVASPGRRAWMPDGHAVQQSGQGAVRAFENVSE